MNQKQKLTIAKILSIIRSWETTNDITSPTLYSDIGEELKLLENVLDEFELTRLDNNLTELLNIIENL